MADGCQAIVSDPEAGDGIEYCGDTPTEEYELAVPYDGRVATGSAEFCDGHEPPEEHKA